MSIASIAAGAKVRVDTPWMTPGEYTLLQVTEVKEIEKPGKLLFIANMDVLESSGEEAIEAGLDTGYCVDCLRFEGSEAGNILKFLSAVTKTAPQDISQENIEMVLDEEQPLTGALVRAKAWTHVTKNDKHITRVKFYAATEDDVTRAPALRTKLGLSPLPVV